MSNLLNTTTYRAIVCGSCASVLSAAVLAMAGRKENRSAAAPINAVSHWYWGDEALHQRDTDVKHTLVGYVTHHGAAMFWAAFLAAFLQRNPTLNTPTRLALTSAATSGIACFVDFKLTPQRLTPGYEHRLSHKALAATYLVFAVGLALGAWVTRPRDRHSARTTS